MARIMIVNWAEKNLEVSDLSRTLLGHLHDHHLDWMHSCGGKGRCTTCKAIIIGGWENLSPPTAAEQAYLTQGALRGDERLACQVRITGDISIAVPAESGLPHIRYQ